MLIRNTLGYRGQTAQGLASFGKFAHSPKHVPGMGELVGSMIGLPKYVRGTLSQKAFCVPVVLSALLVHEVCGAEAQPFGAEFPRLDSLAVGEWWKAAPPKQNPPPSMDVPRGQVVA